MTRFVYFIFTLLCFVMITDQALSWPTVEGFFRNGNNPQITGNYVQVTLKIERVYEQNILKIYANDKSSMQEDTEIEEEKFLPIYLKLIFSNEGKDQVELLQVVYGNSKMKEKSILKVDYFPNLLLFGKEDKYLERSLFYGMMAMFTLNDSKLISKFLDQNGIGFEYNKNIMNQDLLNLYQRQKDYLIAITDDKELKETLESPLWPSDNIKRLKVKNLLKQSMYKKSDLIEKIKKGLKFFWKINLETITAFFTNELHRLEELNVNSGPLTIKVNCGNYMLFDGIHELPKTTMLKDTKNRVFQITLWTLKNFNKRSNWSYQQSKKYQKILEKQKKVKKYLSIRAKMEKIIDQIFVY